mgnify:CR=1 FL=1
MPKESFGVHYRATEFLYRNWHYEPGWYFYDEEQDLYGPFFNEEHCRNGLQLYIMQLMAGEAPTQLSEAEKQQLLAKLK